MGLWASGFLPLQAAAPLGGLTRPVVHGVRTSNPGIAHRPYDYAHPQNENRHQWTSTKSKQTHSIQKMDVHGQKKPCDTKGRGPLGVIRDPPPPSRSGPKAPLEGGEGAPAWQGLYIPLRAGPTVLDFVRFFLRRINAVALGCITYLKS